jgi:surfeit locus 1 family protein
LLLPAAPPERRLEGPPRAAPHDGNAVRRSLFLVLPLIVLAFVVLVGLGIWQLQRNDWKQGLVEERTQRTAALPVPATAIFDAPADDIDYRRAVVIGQWDHEHSLILANRVRFATRGEELVTPLLLPEGRAVLVNRGWYPETERDAVLADLEGTSDAEAVGLVRYVGDIGGRQTPAGTWTRLDTAAIGATLPYEVADWYLVEGELLEDGARPGDGLPVQGFAAFTNSTPHMQYALTWFGLAVALVVVALFRLVYAPRHEAEWVHEPPEDPDPAT